jgi:hypothetical protein
VSSQSVVQALVKGSELAVVAAAAAVVVVVVAAAVVVVEIGVEPAALGEH